MVIAARMEREGTSRGPLPLDPLSALLDSGARRLGRANGLAQAPFARYSSRQSKPDPARDDAQLLVLAALLPRDRTKRYS